MKRSYSEKDLLHMLRTRICGSGENNNGHAAAFITHVRNQTGFASRKRERYADAISLGLWPSRGLLLEGYEVKCSRADWLRELARPEKADDFFQYCDRWWLVVGDEKIVQAGELPPPWGLLAVKGKTLRVVRESPKHKPKTIDRAFLAGLMRSAVRVGDATPEAIKDAQNRARESERSAWEGRLDIAEKSGSDMRGALDRFAETSGVRIDPSGNGWYGSHKPEEVGRAVRLVLEGETQVERVEQRLRQIATMAEHLAERIREIVPVPAESP